MIEVDERRQWVQIRLWSAEQSVGDDLKQKQSAAVGDSGFTSGAIDGDGGQ